MLSKKMINLCKKENFPEVATDSPESNERDPRGPTIYIHDIDLGFMPTDIDQEFTAEVKIVPRRISTSSERNKKTQSYDIEVKAIDIQGA